MAISDRTGKTLPPVLFLFAIDFGKRHVVKGSKVMTKIIAVANQKGGVGKTTTTMNVGAALARAGKRVLLVDLDPQANLSAYLGFEPDKLPTISDLMATLVNGADIDVSAAIRNSEAEQLDYIPSVIQLSAAEFFLVTAFSRETVLKRLLEHPTIPAYDYILIDCLPSLGVLFMNALTAADELLIPVQAQKLAMDAIPLVMNAYQQVKGNLNPKLQISGILLTMVDNTQMARVVEQTIREAYGALVCSTVIHKSVEASTSTYAQKSLVVLNRKLGFEYTSVTAELLGEGEQNGEH